MLFAYFGPETVLPITSTLAALVGFLLMFGRHTVRMAAEVGRRALFLKTVKRPVMMRSAGRRFRQDGPASASGATTAAHSAAEKVES